jgi:hypothetical protein
MLNNLESTIQSVIGNATRNMAAEIASAIRTSLAKELGAIVAGDGTAPVKRPPGRPRKNTAAPPAAADMREKATAPAATAISASRRSKTGGKAPRVSEVEMKVVLDALANRPGLTSLQIQKEAGIDGKQAARVLLKLRKTSRVKWKGKRSAATYTAA